MDEKTLISILIPNYNRGKLMAETLASIIAQSYPHWEAIVVDDGSNDESNRIANEFVNKDNRIKYFKRDRTPNGAPTCRNIAFEKSEGEFLIFLDSDDLLAPFCLEQRINSILKNPDCDFWVFPMLLFKNDLISATNLWNKANGRSELLRFLELDAVWQTSGPIWRRKSVQRIGGFSEGLACWQDVDFHLKALIQNFKYIILDYLKPDIYYRQHESGSISQGEISTPPKMLSRQKIFMDHSLALQNKMTDEIRSSLKVLGTNVVIGAVKSLNHSVANKSLSFGLKNKIFDIRFLIKVRFLQLMFLLRLNRLPLLDQFIQFLIKRRRVVSSIGKFHYIQNQ